MRDYELELIAGLVEGRLGDESEARALIASSPEAAEEYEAQKLAFETLRGLGPVSMSDTERATLHRDVWTTLRAQPSAKTANPWWYRWTAIAAALLVVGGSAAVLSQNMGDGAGGVETFAEIGEPLDSGEEESATTTAAAAEAPAESDDDAGGGDGAITTVADAEDRQGGSSDQPVTLLSARASDVRQGAVTEPDMKFYEHDDAVDPAISGCVTMATEDAGLEGFTLVATMDDPVPAPDGSTTTSTETVIAIQPDLAVASPPGADPAAAPLAFVDLDTCEVVYLDE